MRLWKCNPKAHKNRKYAQHNVNTFDLAQCRWKVTHRSEHKQRTRRNPKTSFLTLLATNSSSNMNGNSNCFLLIECCPKQLDRESRWRGRIFREISPSLYLFCQHRVIYPPPKTLCLERILESIPPPVVASKCLAGAVGWYRLFRARFSLREVRSQPPPLRPNTGPDPDPAISGSEVWATPLGQKNVQIMVHIFPSFFTHPRHSGPKTEALHLIHLSLHLFPHFLARGFPLIHSCHHFHHIARLFSIHRLIERLSDVFLVFFGSIRRQRDIILRCFCGVFFSRGKKWFPWLHIFPECSQLHSRQWLLGNLFERRLTPWLRT